MDFPWKKIFKKTAPLAPKKSNQKGAAGALPEGPSLAILRPGNTLLKQSPRAQNNLLTPQ
jgi:hypothetical protein